MDYTTKFGEAPVCETCTGRHKERVGLTELVDNGKGYKYKRPQLQAVDEGATMRATVLNVSCLRAHHERGCNPGLAANGKSCDEYKEKPAA